MPPPAPVTSATFPSKAEVILSFYLNLLQMAVAPLIISLPVIRQHRDNRPMATAAMKDTRVNLGTDVPIPSDRIVPNARRICNPETSGPHARHAPP
jgi:hypothetical protein